MKNEPLSILITKIRNIKIRNINSISKIDLKFSFNALKINERFCLYKQLLHNSKLNKNLPINSNQTAVTESFELLKVNYSIRNLIEIPGIEKNFKSVCLENNLRIKLCII